MFHKLVEKGIHHNQEDDILVQWWLFTKLNQEQAEKARDSIESSKTVNQFIIDQTPGFTIIYRYILTH